MPPGKKDALAGVGRSSPQQQAEIRRMVTRGDKTAADAALLFRIHPATVCRLLARRYPQSRRPNKPNNVGGTMLKARVHLDAWCAPGYKLRCE